MKKFMEEHPYTVTSGIFIVLIVFGFLFLHWRKDEYGFVLLLYFIVTLGIRLDDISRQLGIGHGAPTTFADKNDRMISLMQQIQQDLTETNAKLTHIQAAMDHGAEPSLAVEKPYVGRQDGTKSDENAPVTYNK